MNEDRSKLMLSLSQVLKTEGFGATYLFSADVDGLKALNDRQGIGAGDATLQLMRGLAAEKLAGYEIAFSGKEVFGFFRNSEAEAAPELCRLEGFRFAFEAGSTLGATMTIGVIRAQPGSSPSQLFEHAFNVMKRGKSEGGNRVLFQERPDHFFPTVNPLYALK